MKEQQSLVVVPAHPGAGDQLVFEARRQPEGVVLPVFSSVRFLVAALGQSQPWAVLPLARVMAAAAAASVDRVALDPEVSDEAWRWEPLDLGGFSWRQPT
jgi:hypothetical protein